MVHCYHIKNERTNLIYSEWFETDAIILPMTLKPKYRKNQIVREEENH